MTSSTNLKKIISLGAALLLAVGGSFVATDAANATVSSHINSISVNRLNSATRGASSTYVTNASSAERISSFVYDENFGGLIAGGALSVAFTLPTGVTATFNNGMSVTPTTSGGSYQSNGSSVSPYTTYTATLAADSSRTGVNLRTNMQLSGLAMGQSLTVTVVATLAGNTITPIGSPTGTTNGFGTSDTIRGTSAMVVVSSDSYTAVSGDFGASPQANYATNCIWPGSTTATAGQVYQTVWSNGSGPAITSSYANSTYYTTSPQTVAGTYASGSTSFTVPNPAPEVLNIMPTAVIAGIQPGDVIAPAFKVVKQGTSVDLLEPCTRDEALPAPTVTANPSSSSVTVNLTVPTASSHFAGWPMAQVFACVASITDCGARSNFGRIDASFGYMGSINTSATSVTFDAQHAISYTFVAGQQMPRWDPSVEYRYVVIYMPTQGTNYQGISAASAAISVSVPTSNAPSAPSTTPSPSTTPTTSTPTSVAPAWQAPLMNSVLTIGKKLATDGGKLALTEGDFSGLKSVTVGGKAIEFTTGSNGSVTIPVPAGKVGTADLTLTFNNGTITIQDGIKYVAPVDVAKVAESTISGFTKNSVKVSPALAASIQYAAQINRTANSVVCTGYAASKAEMAVATARATATCGYATKVNDLLVNKTVKVLVSAKLAKTAAVGIKVYK